MSEDAAGIPHAFCVIFWADHGGLVDSSGRPVGAACLSCQGSGAVEGVQCTTCEGLGSDPRQKAMGYCSYPWDCYNCSRFQEQQKFYPPEQQWWLCIDCVQRAYDWAKETDNPILVPGHYGEGYCQSPQCARGPKLSIMLQFVVAGLPWR